MRGVCRFFVFLRRKREQRSTPSSLSAAAEVVKKQEQELRVAGPWGHGFCYKSVNNNPPPPVVDGIRYHFTM